MNATSLLLRIRRSKIAWARNVNYASRISRDFAPQARSQNRLTISEHRERDFVGALREAIYNEFNPGTRNVNE